MYSFLVDFAGRTHIHSHIELPTIPTNGTYWYVILRSDYVPQYTSIYLLI